VEAERIDLAVVGAGAAGLMAAIAAGRAARAAGRRPGIALFDGARTLGAKILVAGGGRCNVTHDTVTAEDYAGSSRNAIRKVLQRFGVAETVAFFRELGVDLKREETGKLFPVTDRARTVLDALLEAARDAGAAIRHRWRIEGVAGDEEGFLLTGGPSIVRAARVILATGGRSLPKSGSDGHGFEIARSLGHTITARVTPALVALLLEESSPLRALSGLTLPATIELRSATGKRLLSFTDSTLLTHWGVSGPSVLDISRYWLDAPAGSRLLANWLPGETTESLDRALTAIGPRTVARFLAERVPQRLADVLCAVSGVDPRTPGHSLERERRRALAACVCAMDLPVTGDRGWNFAEATAGGVPLGELRLETMESRVRPGLFLCGELCDVDGRIGGFNFQWAWASGHVAGRSAIV